MAKKRRRDREAERRLAQFQAQQRGAIRQRRVFGILSAVALGAALGCGSGVPLPLACLVAPDAWMLVWAALVGWFLGLTIRIVLERRRFRKANEGRDA